MLILVVFPNLSISNAARSMLGMEITLIISTKSLLSKIFPLL